MSTPSQQQAPNDMDCLQIWKEELRRVQNALIKAIAEKDKACYCLESITDIKLKLNTYKDKIETTDEILTKIEAEFVILNTQIETDVCVKTECTVKVMKILYCFIREFLSCLDELREDVSSYIGQIEALNLNKPSIVLDCLQTLLAKINAVAAMQEKVMKLMIEIVQTAVDINNILCRMVEDTAGGNEGDQDTMVMDSCSLGGIVNGLTTFYSDPAAYEGFPTFETDDKLDEGDGQTTDDDLVIEISQFMGDPCPDPTIFFPLLKTPYYKKLEVAVGDIDIVCQDVKALCDKKRREADELIACKENLENAISAGEEAKACSK